MFRRPPRPRSERLREIVPQILDVLDADRDADEVVGDADPLPLFRGNRRMRHRRWMADQRFDAAKALRERHQLHGVQQRPRLLERAETERDDAAEAAHLPPGELVVRMIGKPGIVHLRDLRMGGEELRQRQAVLVVPLHADRQRLGAAQHQPRVHRSEDGALGVLHESQPLDVIVAHGHHDAADAVAVTVEKLGGAVDDEVGAELDRTLDVGAGERVVDDHEGLVCVSDVARRRKSVIRRTGLVGVSRNSIFVAGRMAASIAPVSDVST